MEKCSTWTRNSVLVILKKTHHKLQKVDPKHVATPDCTIVPYHPTLLYSLYASRSRSGALKTQESVGPFGIEVNQWHRFLTSFDLRIQWFLQEHWKTADRLATGNIDSLDPYKDCRLAASIENPGVMPFYIGKVLRRIISCSIANCLQKELKLFRRNFNFASVKRERSSREQCDPHPGGRIYLGISRGNHSDRCKKCLQLCESRASL